MEGLTWAWECSDGSFSDVTTERPKGIAYWRPIRIIPGTERAVVRRLVPGPIIEGEAPDGR